MHPVPLIRSFLFYIEGRISGSAVSDVGVKLKASDRTQYSAICTIYWYLYGIYGY